MATNRLSRIETNIEKPTVEHIELKRAKKDTESPQVEEVDSSLGDFSYDLEIEKSVVRKFDTRVIPWLFGMFLMCFLDRANVGNAKIEGLGADLHLDSTKYNIALAIFFVPYILVEFPSNMIIKRVGAGFYLPFLTCAYGLVCMCIGFVKSYKGLLIARFFLGFAEGGLAPGLTLYLSMFYKKEEQGFRIAMFFCAAPAAGAIGGLLASGLSRIHLNGYNGWPWIFFIEGAMTLAFGLVTMIFLPDTPEKAKFLTEAEHAVAAARMRADNPPQGPLRPDSIDPEHFSWLWVRRAVTSPNLFFVCLGNFCIAAPVYSFALFLPSIVAGLGYKSIQAQLLTVPPNVLGFTMALISGWLSDKYRMRGPFLILWTFIGCIGYAIQLGSPNPTVRYAGTFFVAFIFSNAPLAMSWISNNLSPHYVRATGLAIQVMAANCAGFIATFSYVESDKPRYMRGHAINLAMLLFALLPLTAGTLYVRWENARRDAGERDHLIQGKASEKADELGHLHPQYRYMR